MKREEVSSFLYTMAKIKPSQREKKRYIVFSCKGKLSAEDARKAIKKAILRYIGEFGFEKTRFLFIKNCFTGSRGIVRVTNKSMPDVKKVFENTTFKIIGISGILKKAKHKFLTEK